MNEIHNKLPIYRAVVNEGDETGMTTISLVDAPAVEADFLYFNEDIKPLNYAVDNEEQRKVFGLVMSCDTPIYRRDNSGYEYYIFYDRKTIELMAEKYLKLNRQNNVDLQHSFELEEGIFLNEIFIKDSERGIAPKGFEAVKDGSLFATFHVLNDEVWTAIKEGTFKGFSLSGLFYAEETFKEQINKDNKETFKMKINRIKTILRSLLVEMGEVATDRGVLVWNGEEDLKAGDTVKTLNEAGEEIDAEDGEYRTEDRKTIIVKDGKVEEIKDAEAEVADTTKVAEDEAKGEENAEETPKAEEEMPKTEDERDARIAELEAEIAEKKAEIDEKAAEIDVLKARIAELENEPADKSAEQRFAETVDVEDKTPKGKMTKRGYKFNK